MLSRWPIRNKLLFGIGLLLVIVITMSISSIQGTYAYRNLVRSLSSRATELPEATLLLAQVGDLRVTLAELQTQSSILEDLSFGPTGQKLSETFREKFAAIRDTVGRYRALLEEHEHAEFRALLEEQEDPATRIGDASREWKKLQEIEQCLATIELLTIDPERDEEPHSDEAAAESDSGNQTDKFNAMAESVSDVGEPSLMAAIDADGSDSINLGHRYSSLKSNKRPTHWYSDHQRTTRLATQELIKLQNYTRELPGYLQWHMHRLVDDVKSRYRTWIVLTWICAVAATALTVLFILLLYRWVFRPLRCLVKGSRRVASGDFNFRIELGSHDEMRELAEAMNEMTLRFRTIRDDLDRQVQVRTKQVVRSEQLASVGFLAAGVAHEINNPLASIAMCAESLEGRLLELAPKGSEQGELVQRYLHMIQTEAFRCKGITEKLLDFSRVGEVRRQTADLREVVEAVIDMVRHLGKYQNRHIEFAPGEPVFSLINAQEIKQVILNLVTNALDSVDDGGTLEIRLAQQGEFAEIVFTDNGCGMTEEVLEHLFTPFFTRKRGGQGTGLGLSIVCRIVGDHGGQIEATSEGPGRGSQFHVTLPLAEASSGASNPSALHHGKQEPIARPAAA